MAPFLSMLFALYTLFLICHSKTCTNGTAPDYTVKPKKLKDGRFYHTTLTGNPAEGFPVPQSFISRNAWGATPWPSTGECPIAFQKTKFITIHHTAERQITDINAGKRELKLIQINHKHRTKGNGWTDIGYHFIIDSVGNVYQGRPFYDDAEMPEMLPIKKNPKKYTWPRPRFVKGAHTKKHNIDNVGISVMGCYMKHGCSKQSKIVQYDKTYINLVQLVSYLCKYLELNCVPEVDTIRTHKSWPNNWTPCPGKISKMMEMIRKDVKDSINGDGLCIDYEKKPNEAGKCIDPKKQKCDSGVIISAANKQCQYGYKCCKMTTGSGGTKITGSGKKKKKTAWKALMYKWKKYSAHIMDENGRIDDDEDDGYQYTNGVYDGSFIVGNMSVLGVLLFNVLCVLFCCMIGLIGGAVCGYVVGNKMIDGKHQELEQLYQGVDQHNVDIDGL